jgi:hypothetical protein
VEESTCKGCGKKIVWGMTQDRKKIPLDPVAPVYMIKATTDDCVRTLDAMVSHFATCSHASEFSKSKRHDYPVGKPSGKPLAIMNPPGQPLGLRLNDVK